MNDCLSLSSQQLKSLLSQYNVPGRSRLTTKRAMCEELIRLDLPLSESSPTRPTRRSPRGVPTLPASSDYPVNPGDSKYYMDDCLSFDYHELKSMLGYHSVPYRSKLTTKDSMCQELQRRNLPLAIPRQSPSPPQSQIPPQSQAQSPRQSQRPQAQSSRPQNPRPRQSQAQSPPQLRAQSPRQSQAQQSRAQQSRARQSRAVPPVVPDMSRLSLLPMEVQLEILKKLDSETLLEVCRVNKEFANLCRDEQLWRHLVEQDFGTSTKLVGNESWYANYRIFSRRQKFLDLFTPEAFEPSLTIYNVPATITDDAMEYLRELFKPMIDELITMPNTPNQIREFINIDIPESLRNEMLRYYQQTQDETWIVKYILIYMFDILAMRFNYNDYDEEGDDEITITRDNIRQTIDDDDYEFKSIFNNY